MSGTIAWIFCLTAPLGAQDAVQQQIDDALRQFQTATEVEQALALLSSQLSALGAQATNPIARRLADQLREGMASAAVPALIDALSGRPEAVAPLQTAFRDATTSAAGRIELANALLQLDDTMSWREGLIAIASDARATLADRLHAAGVLHEVEDPQGSALLRSIVNGLPDRPEGEHRQVIDFLSRVNSRETRLLLGTIASDDRLSEATRRAAVAGLHPPLSSYPEEPAVRIVDEPSRLTGPGVPRAALKKKETREETYLTMPRILVGGVTLVLLVLLLVEVLRKG